MFNYLSNCFFNCLTFIFDDIVLCFMLNCNISFYRFIVLRYVFLYNGFFNGEKVYKGFFTYMYVKG